MMRNSAVAAPSSAPTAVAVTNGNSFAQGLGFEDKAMRAKIASEVEERSRARMEAKMVESQDFFQDDRDAAPGEVE
jgi:hypothetical protein